MAKYANILETVGNTPVVRINKLAPAHVNLFVKIEAFNPLGSVKDRLALGVIEAAEKSGELKPGQTVIEATSGNTGIGLAMVCAAKGYPFVCTMAETFSVERRKLMRFLGAKVVITPAAGRGFGMVEKAKELAAKNGWFLTRQFENEANPDMHSRTTAREIVNDFKGEKLDYWVTGFGTGGTLKGVARVFHAARLRGEDQLGAIGLHRLHALDGQVLGHDQHHAIALDGGGHRQRDAGVARGGLDQRVARLDLAAFLGAADHPDRRPVLDGAGRVVALQLAQHDVAARGDLGADDALQPHQRRVADGLLEGHVRRHWIAIRWNDELDREPALSQRAPNLAFVM